MRNGPRIRDSTGSGISGRPPEAVVLCILIVSFFAAVCSCTEGKSRSAGTPAEASSANGSITGNTIDPTADSATNGGVTADAELVFPDKLRRVLSKALIPGDLSRRIMAAAGDGPNFILDLLACLEGDPFLRRLVDKTHALGDYEPEDLTELTGGSYMINRHGLLLRQSAARSLEVMAAAARVDGVSLTASSTYRSYTYQEELYSRYVREDGQEAADRFSAWPGYSQHQTGLVVDFGSIDDTFAETRAGRWLLANGSRYGWSLSFPRDYEAVTGYVWESWHYRYVGPELAAFIDTYFDGIQQYALQFIHEWEHGR